MGVNWISWSVDKGLPDNAVIGGTEGTAKVYIIRAKFSNSLVVGKFLPELAQAYISDKIKEHFIKDFEILVGNGYRWVKGTCGNVPNGAVQGGIYTDGEIIYVGRLNDGNNTIPGSFHPSHKKVFYGYHSKEISSGNYDILCV